jgi:hypothetical protein
VKAAEDVLTAFNRYLAMLYLDRISTNLLIDLFNKSKSSHEALPHLPQHHDTQLKHYNSQTL